MPTTRPIPRAAFAGLRRFAGRQLPGPGRGLLAIAAAAAASPPAPSLALPRPSVRGQTHGTYRDRIPTPPVLDLAWLKQWWPETSHVQPHAGDGKPRLKTFAITWPDAAYETTVKAFTKTHARKIAAGFRSPRPHRLPPFTTITRVA